MARDIVVLTPCIPSASNLNIGQAKIMVLDVGPGLATVVENRHHLLIFDTGASFGQYTDMGERVILPYLSTQNPNKAIDKVIISHVDIDHAGGLPSLVRLKRVQQIMTSEPSVIQERLMETNPFSVLPEITVCQTNQSW
jgi:competence protein ComEC